MPIVDDVVRSFLLRDERRHLISGREGRVVASLSTTTFRCVTLCESHT